MRQFGYNARMSANPPNQITVDPRDPEQALALLNHIARTFQADASTHDAIRQAVETLKGSLADQATWKTIAEWGTAPEVLALIRRGIAADAANCNDEPVSGDPRFLAQGPSGQTKVEPLDLRTLHVVKGFRDRPCELCSLPDSHPVHGLPETSPGWIGPAHAFEGRLDRWCEVCNCPDRHPIHFGEDGKAIIKPETSSVDLHDPPPDGDPETPANSNPLSVSAQPTQRSVSTPWSARTRIGPDCKAGPTKESASDNDLSITGPLCTTPSLHPGLCPEKSACRTPGGKVATLRLVS